MGAEAFSVFAEGKDAHAAFKSAVEEAQYEHGHGGYSGTIAEKRRFVMIGSAPDRKSAGEIAGRLIDEDDPRIEDKWGPAGYISIDAGGFIFFGWASI